MKRNIILKKVCFLAFMLLMSIHTFAQNENYRIGIYKEYTDFKNIIPSDTITKFRKRTGKNVISHRFYSLYDNKRLKKEFAFYAMENLYVNIKQMVKRFPKEDRSQLKDDGNYCVKAIQVGKRYVYFEDYFTSKSAAIFGGLIGGSAARRLKPIIYDRKKQVFNLFKNAKDFESFLKQEHPKYLKWLTTKEGNKKTRKKTIENKELIRKIIFDINKNSK